MSEPGLLPPPNHPARKLALFLLIVAPFAFGALALALGQDANWDLRNYHWYNAYALLNGRYSFDFLPSQTPWFYNPVLDVPFYLLATHVPAIVAGYGLGFVQGLNFILLFMLAYASFININPWGKTFIAALLALLGMLGGGGLALIGTTFYDNITSLGLFLSALLVLSSFEALRTAPASQAFRRALLFGLPAGLAMGLKLPSVIFSVGFCFAILAAGPWRRCFLISFAFGLGVLIGVAVSLGPWMIFLGTHYGNPLFPYFNDIFKSPMAPQVSARDEEFLPHGWLSILSFPFSFAKNPYLVGEISWRDWRIPILYGFVPLAVSVRLLVGNRGYTLITRPEAVRYLLTAGALSYLVWVFLFAIYRYLTPLEMLSPLLIVLTAGLLPFGVRTRIGIAALLLVIVATSIEPGDWGRRAAWLDHFVEAEIPPLGMSKDPLILMAGDEPYSHVVPEFPPHIPFVRIASNFAEPGANPATDAIIRTRLAQHKGDFLLLMPSWQLEAADDALLFFGLERAPEPCQNVVDRLYDDKRLSLCKVIRRTEVP
jgi:hypothetical protein